KLDAVLYIHAHADQAHGSDELRMVAMNNRARVDVYMDETTESWLTSRFDYCFKTPPGSSYPPILNAHKLIAHEPVTIDGEGGPVRFEPLLLEHGSIPALGFKMGGIAYSPDVSGVPQQARDAIAGIDCWIVDALRRAPHPSHANLDRSLEWVAEVKPKLGVLTNMHVDLDYQTLCNELPDGVIPAYDGMVLEYPL
ncbi:MAG: MBL fold metallo-hydrolase, partial [Candidatus Phaeomarinobacter sp.]